MSTGLVAAWRRANDQARTDGTDCARCGEAKSSGIHNHDYCFGCNNNDSACHPYRPRPEFAAEVR